MSIRRLPPLALILVAVTVVGLVIDAWVHLDLASAFAHVKTSTMSQADLFRVEAVLAIVAAVALLIRPRQWSAGFAFLISAGGFVAVVVYRYVDVGQIGPIPNMYDPFWLPTGKWVSAIAEAAAAAASAVLFVMLARPAGAAAPVQAGRAAPPA